MRFSAWSNAPSGEVVVTASQYLEYTGSLDPDRPYAFPGGKIDNDPSTWDLVEFQAVLPVGTRSLVAGLYYSNAELAGRHGYWDSAAIEHFLVPEPSTAGDYDSSGVVDGADFLLWQYTMGQTGIALEADGNANRIVDAGDLTVWEENFGEFVSATNSNVTVPEPASASTFLLVVCCLAWQRRCMLACSLRARKLS